MFSEPEEQILKEAEAIQDPVDGAWRKNFDGAKFKFSHSGGYARCSVHVGDIAVGIESKRGLSGLVASVIEKMDSGFIPTWKMDPSVREWLEKMKPKEQSK